MLTGWLFSTHAGSGCRLPGALGELRPSLRRRVLESGFQGQDPDHPLVCPGWQCAGLDRIFRPLEAVVGCRGGSCSPGSRAAHPAGQRRRQALTEQGFNLFAAGCTALTFIVV